MPDSDFTTARTSDHADLPEQDLQTQVHQTMREQLKTQMNQVLKTLTYREREIIKLRYGLADDGYIFTMEEVGRIFKITSLRARSIEAKALRKLQHPVRSRHLEKFIDTLASEGPTDPEGYAHLVRDLFGTHYGPSGPNLFHYATKELSQDAFFCWLIEWAHRRQERNDAAMHQTGVFFLNSLLGLHGIEAPDTYESLEIERQYMGLDILVLVNRDIAVLIEDKTASSEHTDQLERYLKAVRADYPSRMLAPVYLKIRNQACLKAVIDAGWQCFLRHDLLRVLAYGNRQGVKNDIFTHYHARLLRLDRKWWRQRAITNIPPQQSRFD